MRQSKSEQAVAPIKPSTGSINVPARVTTYPLSQMPSLLDREIQTADADAFGHHHFAHALASLVEWRTPAAQAAIRARLRDRDTLMAAAAERALALFPGEWH